MPVNVYKVAVTDGKEELLRSYSVKPIQATALRKIAGMSDKNMVYNYLFTANNSQPITASFMYASLMGVPNGAPVSFIIPDAMLIKEIEIEKGESSDASYDETKGQLKWTLKLASADPKKLKFDYTVKYPKDKSVYVE